jgi:hypothetical protein
MDYVWYLSYGSNMLENRFLCYIKGETFIGNGYKEEGCKDKTLPVKSKAIMISNELYFAKSSPRWSGGGVAFIKEPSMDQSDKIEKKTYAKMYLITKDQFEDVVKQENRISIKDPLVIDYPKLHQSKSFILFPDKFYGRLLYLGQEENYPIYSFTSPIDDVLFKSPSEAYILSILTGIRLNFNTKAEELYDVFSSLKGIFNHIDLKILKEIIEKK